MPVFELLLNRNACLEAPSEEGFPPLWYALQDSETREMATNLIFKGASTDTVRFLSCVIALLLKLLQLSRFVIMMVILFCIC